MPASFSSNTCTWNLKLPNCIFQWIGAHFHWNGDLRSRQKRGPLKKGHSTKSSFCATKFQTFGHYYWCKRQQPSFFLEYLSVRFRGMEGARLFFKPSSQSKALHIVLPIEISWGHPGGQTEMGASITTNGAKLANALCQMIRIIKKPTSLDRVRSCPILFRYLLDYFKGNKGYFTMMKIPFKIIREICIRL